jgi:hypothetical protein
MEIAHIQTPLGIAKITGNENEFPLFLFQMKELFRLQLPLFYKQRLLNSTNTLKGRDIVLVLS